MIIQTPNYAEWTYMYTSICSVQYKIYYCAQILNIMYL